MKKYNINNDWLFSKDDINKNPKWDNVELPHTWNNIDGQDGGNDYYRNVCHYKKVLEVKQIDQAMFIEFEGVNNVAEVYFNNTYLGRHEGGYALFRFEITNFVELGNNEIIVSVDNQHNEDIYPLMADFTFYGGIYRNVNLIMANNTRFSLLNDGGEGVNIWQDNISAEKAEFTIVSNFDHLIKNKNYTLKTFVLNELDEVVLSSDDEIDNSKSNSKISLSLKNPRLWNGLKDPYLYNIIVELHENDVLIDHRVIPTGFRSIEINDEGFFLNGVKTKLNGVSRHQDRQNYGNAITKEMHDEDLAIIKEIGANAIRLAHYQQDKYFYELADKQGYLIWAEIPYITRSSKTDKEGLNAKLQLEELISQNFNHPSIVMWGIQNEITAFGKEDNIEIIVNELNSLAKRLDPTRPTVQAQLSRQPIKDSINTVTDLLGYNLYFGWYVGSVEDLDPWLKQYEENKIKPILSISEYGVDSNIELHSEEPKMQDYSEEYQSYWHERAYSIMNKYDFIWGTFVWNMFDFGSDFREGGGIKGRNQKGLVTFDRTTRKDAFYYYKAKWSMEPFVHITSKRFVKRHLDEITIKVYSNQTAVEITHNGVKLNNIIKDDVVFTTKVKLAEGSNKIVVTSNKLFDEALFIKVNNEEPSYKFIKEEQAGNIFGINAEDWIDSESENLELDIIDTKYFSIDDTIASVLDHDLAKEVFNKYFGHLDQNTKVANVKGMSIKMITRFNPKALPKSMLVVINRDLQKIKK